MIEEEIGEGSLVRLSPVQPIGPFVYWLDVEPESVAVEPVVAFVGVSYTHLTLPTKSIV